MPLLKTDSSMRPGWVREYYDGSGWTGKNEVESRQNGWSLLITMDGIAAVDGGFTNTTSEHLSNPHTADFAHLLERAMTGCQLSFKALFLMAYNDPRYSEYRDTVEALRPTYESLTD